MTVFARNGLGKFCSSANSVGSAAVGCEASGATLSWSPCPAVAAAAVFVGATSGQEPGPGLMIRVIPPHGYALVPGALPLLLIMSRMSLTHSSYVRCVLALLVTLYVPSRQLALARTAPIVAAPSFELHPHRVEPGKAVNVSSAGLPQVIG